MEEDEQLASLMRGLSGQNLNDSQFANENVNLRLVEVLEALYWTQLTYFITAQAIVETGEALPFVYDPDIISAYWGKRPRAVATFIVQFLSVAGGFLSHLALDLITKKVKEALGKGPTPVLIPILRTLA
ncbi:uncharacterized protein M6B38_371930 [Iris pallida]|uniref:Uncharacterized protein n=1 Tax=Iris pallida TaxID=29817 RepID=A0AAX6GE40_IRIPA|nr:uncharacterized protein M6B38_371930 [Iris pallida]